MALSLEISILYLRLIAPGDKWASSPAIRSYPGEVTSHVVSVYSSHKLSNFLVRSKYHHTYKENAVSSLIHSHSYS